MYICVYDPWERGNASGRTPSRGIVYVWAEACRYVLGQLSRSSTTHALLPATEGQRPRFSVWSTHIYIYICIYFIHAYIYIYIYIYILIYPQTSNFLPKQCGAADVAISFSIYNWTSTPWRFVCSKRCIFEWSMSVPNNKQRVSPLLVCVVVICILFLLFPN
jgi:hypothetical protein